MRISIPREMIQQQAKKMSPEELKQHLMLMKQGTGPQRSKKTYTRKEKHRTH